MTLILVLSLLAAAAAGGAFYYANKREIDKLPEPQADSPTFTDPVPALVENTVDESVAEEPKVKPRRTRTTKGQFVADDPKTPQNEAFEGGVSPKKLRKLPADYELEKMNKATLSALALERGLTLDTKKTKAAMIEELKAFKPSRAKKQ